MGPAGRKATSGRLGKNRQEHSLVIVARPGVKVLIQVSVNQTEAKNRQIVDQEAGRLKTRLEYAIF
jgi:hypothetical protein